MKGFSAHRHGVVVGMLLMLAACSRGAPPDNSGPTAGWGSWGGEPGGQRYSPATQITPENVRGLKVAWVYRIGQATAAFENPPSPQARRKLAEGYTPEGLKLPALEATPILEGGRLYLCSNTNRVVALDPQTGRELWAYDPKIDRAGLVLMNCRGVSYWKDSQATAGAACAQRIFVGTQDARLIALDAADGKPCAGFGHDGSVDLKAGMGEVVPGEYGPNDPPAIVADRVILGGRVNEDMRADMPGGVVRAFDARSGALLWAWNPLPPPVAGATTSAPGAPPAAANAPAAPGAGEPAVYPRSTVNTWSIFSIDVERKLIFIPTGNAQLGIYGGTRGLMADGRDDGRDYYASSVVALDALTGKVVWHFQTVHHDVWDYDVPAQPVLFDFPTAHGKVPAVAQATKQGYIFILNRETGEPLVPVAEQPAPQGGMVPGERLSPTQPAPTNPAYVLVRPPLTEKSMWGFTPWDRGKCRELFRSHRYEGIFSPPSLAGTITYPNNLGVMNWGSVAVDPQRGLLVVNTSHVAGITRLVPRGEANQLFAQGERLMAQIGTPYALQWAPLLSPWGAPCNAPPWGTLVAIDLHAGRKLWEVPLGTTRDLAPFPFWFKLGTPNIGGPLVTASGLTFIGAATDNYLRAFDTRTGEELWKGRLPAGPQATPMTYRLSPDSRQFVVIAAGGHAYMRTTLGDYLVAFSL
ncbi:MAG: pyrroloquinoline quinone-dependent dehydrogenase [Proteobacteria bacterium]|nr:pyrroloquinoline quinone-dependent dehydrogenase [Pseudomonadota bacterium]